MIHLRSDGESSRSVVDAGAFRHPAPDDVEEVVPVGKELRPAVLIVSRHLIQLRHEALAGPVGSDPGNALPDPVKQDAGRIPRSAVGTAAHPQSFRRVRSRYRSVFNLSSLKKPRRRESADQNARLAWSRRP